MNRYQLILVACFAGMLSTQFASAKPTGIEVRVIAKGAKFIGTSMGGAEVSIHDARTGELLAQGKTEGTTGDTGKLMTEKSVRHTPVSTADAAVFRAVVDLKEPRQLKVTARGPVAQRQAETITSVTQWLVPGKPVTGGDGLVLELPGFVVDVLEPAAHVKLPRAAAQSLLLRANVCMMCGCPVMPGALWDADRFEVTAIVQRNGKKPIRVPLRYAGKPSQFQATLEVEQAGVYEVTVFAYDPENGNTGVDKTTFIVAE